MIEGARHPAGGALFDEGSHAFDQLLWLLGMPHSVYGAISSRLGLDCDDTGLAVMRYADGAIAEVISSGAMIAAEDCVEVYGSEGSALLSATDMASREFARALLPLFPARCGAQRLDRRRGGA